MLVRKDLSHPQQVVQACHAILEAAAFLPPNRDHPNVIVCGVRDEPHLFRSLDCLTRAGIRCRSFREPDLGHQLTALATEPLHDSQRHVLQKFPLLAVNS